MSDSTSSVDPNHKYQCFIGGEWVDGERRHLRDRQPRHRRGRRPRASGHRRAVARGRPQPLPTPSRRGRGRRPSIGPTCCDQVAELLDERTAELVPLVQAETGATMRVTKTMQVPQVGGPVPSLRRWRPRAADQSRSSRRSCPPPRSAPGGLIIGAVGAPRARRASSPASRRTTSRSSTWPARSAPRWPWATPWSSSRRRRIRWRSSSSCELFDEAGFPPGVVNIVVCGTDIPASEALVASPHVDMVSFTGSTNVGRRIGEVAGGDMKRQLMELGGKGACIVFDDADLQGGHRRHRLGVGASTPARSAPHRPACIVHRGDPRPARRRAHARPRRHMKVGDPLERDTVVGPVITVGPPRPRRGLHPGRASTRARTVAVGGERPDLDTGFYVSPTLLVDCTSGHEGRAEEIFGPVVVVVPFDDEDEAVAHRQRQRLRAVRLRVLRRHGRAWAVAQQLRSGNVGINSVQRNHEAPFGGFKQSGVGRDGGRFGLHAYSELQSIVWPG